jgi:hypothetical protein
LKKLKKMLELDSYKHEKKSNLSTINEEYKEEIDDNFFNF